MLPNEQKNSISKSTAERKIFGTGELENKQALNYRVTSLKVDEFASR